MSNLSFQNKLGVKVSTDLNLILKGSLKQRDDFHIKLSFKQRSTDKGVTTYETPFESGLQL